MAGETFENAQLAKSISTTHFIITSGLEGGDAGFLLGGLAGSGMSPDRLSGLNRRGEGSWVRGEAPLLKGGRPRGCSRPNSSLAPLGGDLKNVLIP